MIKIEELVKEIREKDREIDILEGQKDILLNNLCLKVLKELEEKFINRDDVVAISKENNFLSVFIEEKTSIDTESKYRQEIFNINGSFKEYIFIGVFSMNIERIKCICVGCDSVIYNEKYKKRT